MIMCMRPRLIIDTSERIRRAAQQRAYKMSASRARRVSLSDFLNELLERELATELAEIDRIEQDEAGGKPPRKRPARPEGP
jgi:hypothetical protein